MASEDQDFVVISDSSAQVSAMYRENIQQLSSLIELFNQSIDAVQQSNILLKDKLHLALQVVLRKIDPVSTNDLRSVLDSIERPTETSSYEVRQSYMKNLCARLVALDEQKQLALQELGETSAALEEERAKNSELTKEIDRLKKSISSSATPTNNGGMDFSTLDFHEHNDAVPSSSYASNQLDEPGCEKVNEPVTQDDISDNTISNDVPANCSEPAAHQEDHEMSSMCPDNRTETPVNDSAMTTLDESSCQNDVEASDAAIATNQDSIRALVRSEIADAFASETDRLQKISAEILETLKLHLSSDKQGREKAPVTAADNVETSENVEETLQQNMGSAQTILDGDKQSGSCCSQSAPAPSSEQQKQPENKSAPNSQTGHFSSHLHMPFSPSPLFPGSVFLPYPPVPTMVNLHGIPAPNPPCPSNDPMSFLHAPFMNVSKLAASSARFAANAAKLATDAMMNGGGVSTQHFVNEMSPDTGMFFNVYDSHIQESTGGSKSANEQTSSEAAAPVTSESSNSESASSAFQDNSAEAKREKKQPDCASAEAQHDANSAPKFGASVKTQVHVAPPFVSFAWSDAMGNMRNAPSERMHTSFGQDEGQSGHTTFSFSKSSSTSTTTNEASSRPESHKPQASAPECTRNASDPHMNNNNNNNCGASAHFNGAEGIRVYSGDAHNERQQESNEETVSTRKMEPNFSTDEEIPICPNCENRFYSRVQLERHLDECLE